MKNASFIKVAAGIIIRNGQYLITKRKPKAHYGGYWEFPGGKCEVQETLEDCLRRELHEELGIDITDPCPYHQLQHAYSDRTVELSFFTCSIIRGEARPLGCQELKWVTARELSDYVFPPADVLLIEMIQKGAGNRSEMRKKE